MIFDSVDEYVGFGFLMIVFCLVFMMVFVSEIVGFWWYCFKSVSWFFLFYVWGVIFVVF